MSDERGEAAASGGRRGRGRPGKSRPWKRRPPRRTEDPRRVAANADRVAEVVESSSYRQWYDEHRCPGAPVWSDFWSYARKSMTYDVEEPLELCGLLWEATSQSFRDFDPSRGDLAVAVEQRFLTYFRFRLATVARDNLWWRSLSELPPDLAHDGPREGSALFRLVLNKLVDLLEDDDRAIVRHHYWRGETIEAIAKRLRRRKSRVVAALRRIRVGLREALERDGDLSPPTRPVCA